MLVFGLSSFVGIRLELLLILPIKDDPQHRLLSMVGQPIKLDGEVLNSLDPNDDRLFKDAVEDGIGFKLFFSF